MKFGLRNITRLLSNLGNPQRNYPSIHVAGSNGKGTSAALIASALSASGYRTGLYSSPHVLDFTERIRVDGRPISRRQLASILNVIRSDIVRHRATFFEAATALAFEHFRRCAVDVAVLEVGLGGRLDATNVVRPIVSVITSIAREHEAILGRGIVRIAREKGGIIKPRVPVVVGDVGRPADRVLRRIAKQRSAPYYDLTGASTRIREESLAGTRFALRGIDGMEGEYRLGLVGKHQVRNAVLALRVLAEVQRRSRFAIGTNAVEKAFSDYERLSGLGARFQVLGRNRKVILDVAHNPAAIRSLVRTIERLSLPKVSVVLGLMQDKDLATIARWISRVASRVVAVRPRTERALEASAIVSEMRRLGTPAILGGDVASGMRLAFRRSRGVILVTGSHFVVGEMLAARWRKEYLTINQ